MKKEVKIQKIELQFNILNFSGQRSLHRTFYQGKLISKSGTNFAIQISKGGESKETKN
jgi:hypothetical protein